ncbi:MAG: 30S ribosomal protein S16 [Bacteroidetes bacterium GWE2_29_8]|nr:MAG: 30S ribosomal protein S16 [Bacteroidetes bacterium GWE2_29_8]OFY20789.1 MAG: 30S ribosomal protein S16 [Bacteroidetes bacterium GWF2_29_10]
MATKIRLQRKGKKGNPFYHVVVADSRAPRDGKFIERLGLYNPLTNPPSIDINFDATLAWYQKGAIPTLTCKNLLSQEGILLKDHLLRGVKKGALTLEQADAKFETWKQEKNSKLKSIELKSTESKNNELKKRFEQEIKVKEKRQELLSKKFAEEVEKNKAVEPKVEEVVVEAKEEEVVVAKNTTETNEDLPTAE